MNGQYILVYYPADREAPLSIRTHTLKDAQQRAGELNTAESVNGHTPPGRWAIHQLTEEITP